MSDFLSISLTGFSHEYNGKPCEDAVFINDEASVACLSDGVSNSNFGGIGAKELVRSIGNWLSMPQVQSTLISASAEAVREQVCNAVDQILLNLCNKYNTSDSSDFASTFLACFQENSTGTILILHAGDGCVFGQPNAEQDTVSVLSGPDNNALGHVFPAGHRETRNRMRVLRLNAADYKAVLLCTDGFSDCYLDQSARFYDSTELAAVFNVLDFNQLNDLVRNLHCSSGKKITDDISCILFRLKPITPPQESVSIIPVFSTELNFDATEAVDPITPETGSPAEEPSNETITAKQHPKKAKDRTKKKKNRQSPAHYGMIIPYILLTTLLILSLINIVQTGNSYKVMARQINGLMQEQTALESQIVRLIEVSENAANQKTSDNEPTTTSPSADSQKDSTPSSPAHKPLK